MADKSSSERVKERREREKEMGMLRLDISLHETTYDMLIKLVEAADYDMGGGEKSKGVNGVLTQLVYEVYRGKDKVKLDRKKQQGFILAQKLKKLKADDVKLGPAKKYVEKEKPSDYLNREDSKWSKKTLNQLIEEYGNIFGPELPPEQKPKVSKKAPVAKKTSKKKVSARADYPADENH